MQILGISGSLRQGSYNTQLLLEAVKELPVGVEFRIYEGLREVPPYDEDDDREPAHPAVTRLRREFASADAILFATPEYNFSVPGWLKNVIDWASRPANHSALRYVPVAVIGASTGAYGAVWSQAELRKVLGSCGARVQEGEVALGHAKQAFESDEPLSAEQRAQLRGLLAALFAQAEQRSHAA
jgi:chromate reductase, NAD(P)H dehydrogenase (quinone)